MRFISVTIAALFFATSVTAGEYVVHSKITSAVISPDGARVVRSADINVPAGKHVIVLPDLNADLVETFLTGPQISFDQPGVQIIAYELRMGGLYPQPDKESDAAKAAKAAFDKAKADLRDLTYQKRAHEAEAEAARERIVYLKSLSQPKEKSAAPTSADIAGSAEAIEAQYLAALKTALAAEKAVEDMADSFDPAERAVKRAQALYDGLRLDVGEPIALAITADFPRATTGQVQMDFVIADDISWFAKYDLNLNQTGDKGKISVARSAVINVDSQVEAWQNVDVTLSSAEIRNQTEVQDPYVRIGRIENPVKYGNDSEAG
ncbi:MAG: hypothetical protein HQ479_14555, partial [Rhodobacter sp.]|nr:hypothetical protein [Rhodobacter sp.]